MNRIILIVVFLITGCTSYGIPSVQDNQEHNAQKDYSDNCLGLQVEVEDLGGGDDDYREWKREQLSKLKASFIADLKKIRGIRIISSGEISETKNFYLLTLGERPYVLNEPFLLVATLGVVPQPMSYREGYKFKIADSKKVDMGEVNTFYFRNDFIGWFTPLIALASTQTLNEEKASALNREKVIFDLRSNFDKLGMFNNCISSGSN